MLFILCRFAPTVFNISKMIQWESPLTSDNRITSLINQIISITMGERAPTGGWRSTSCGRSKLYVSHVIIFRSHDSWYIYMIYSHTFCFISTQSDEDVNRNSSSVTSLIIGLHLNNVLHPPRLSSSHFVITLFSSSETNRRRNEWINTFSVSWNLLTPFSSRSTRVEIIKKVHLWRKSPELFFWAC